MKNEFRRALIMLRAVQNGLNGHVRLERRTRIGSMQISVNGLRGQEQLQAALAVKTDAGWKTVHIGTLGRSGRGQAGLNWNFDPRRIEGLPLESYPVLLIVQTEPGPCKTVLAGYVNGSVQVDWEKAELAACSAYAGAAQPEKIAPADAGECRAPAGRPSTGEIGSAQETGPAPGTYPAPPNAEQADPFELPAAGTSARAGNIPDALDAPAEDPSGASGPPAGTTPDPFDLPAQIASDPFAAPAIGAETALQALGIDPQRPWPDQIEPLREAFAAAGPVYLSAQPGYVFVRAWHSASCPQCAVGIRAKDGRPESVAWAIPGERSEKPPRGLEDYVWKDGWWICTAPAEGGAFRAIAPSGASS